MAKKYIEGLIYRYNRQVQGSFDARKITKIKLEQNCDHDDQEQAHWYIKTKNIEPLQVTAAA